MNRFDGGETRWPEIFPARTAARISVLAGWTGCGVAIGAFCGAPEWAHGGWDPWDYLAAAGGEAARA